MVIKEKLDVSDRVLATGGFADVRRGRYMGHLVAVKTVRVSMQDDLLKKWKVSRNGVFSAAWDAVSIILLQQFCKEVVLWKTLSHPNILKLAGVQADVGKELFTTVSEWMEHGNIMAYIKKNHANRLELVRVFTFLTMSFTKM